MTQDEKIKKLSSGGKKLKYRDFIREIGEAAPEEIEESAKAEARIKSELYSPKSGATGESLARDGLYNGGFADYLKKSFTDEINEDYSKALRSAAVANFNEGQSYRKYLQSYNLSQQKIREGIIEKLINGRIYDKDYAYRLGLEAGLSKENALYTASEGVVRAKKESILEVLDFAVKNDLYPYNAKQYAQRLGLDERSAEIIYNALSQNGYGEKIDYENLDKDSYIQMLKDRINKNN